MWILSFDKPIFYSRGDLGLHCPWSRPFCLLKGCLVYAFVFFFVLFFQYKVCVLRCLSRLYTVYLSPALYCLPKSFFLYLWGGWQYKATNRILKISIECQNLTETVDVFRYNFHSFMVNHQFNIITDFSLALSKYSIQTQPMYPALFWHAGRLLGIAVILLNTGRKTYIHSLYF